MNARSIQPPPQARRPAPPDAAPPGSISPTSARSYLSCPLRYGFEKVLKLKKPVSPALHVGRSVHAALQAFHMARWHGGDDGAPTIARAYEDAFVRLERDEGPVNHPDAEGREKARAAGLRVVQAYLASPHVPVEKPRGVERGLSADVPGLPARLTGVVDLITHDLRPVDFKSAAARPDPEGAAFEHELQLVSYQMLIEESTGETPPSLDLLYLVKTKEPQVIPVSVPPAGIQRRDRVLRMLETAWEGIAARRFHPQPGMVCMGCQFKPECRRWRGSLEGGGG